MKGKKQKKATISQTQKSGASSFSAPLMLFILLAIGGVVLFFSKYALDEAVDVGGQHSKKPPQKGVSSLVFLQEKANKLTEFASHVKADIVLNAIADHKELSKTHVTTAESSCTIRFPATCEMDPRMIKYWDEEADCFESPLRNISGLQNPVIEKRKFVVMQPDLGGWNNIRMALEIGLLFAQVTGRIFVLPPPAVLYLLHRNKKWKDNFSTFADFIDFSRLTAGNGLEVIPMKEFLTTIAARGLLSKPLPDNNTDLAKTPLWDYLESASHVKQWSPGKIFVGFNITKSPIDGTISFGNFDNVVPAQFEYFKLNRTMIPYDEDFDSHRVIYFPGHDGNRFLIARLLASSPPHLLAFLTP